MESITREYGMSSMTQTELMASIFSFQTIVSFFGAHFLLGTPAMQEFTQVTSPEWYEVLLGGIGQLWAYITANNSVAAYLGEMVTFSIKMSTFSVPDMPAIFSAIWLILTFIVIWCLISLIRGTNT